jgi:hypothetical protein
LGHKLFSSIEPLDLLNKQKTTAKSENQTTTSPIVTDKSKIFSHDMSTNKKIKIKQHMPIFSRKKWIQTKQRKAEKFMGEELKSHLPSFIRRRENPNIFGISTSLHC